MIIRDFKPEIWLDKYENDCDYNLSETCVSPMNLHQLQEVLDINEDIADNIMNLKLDYGAITGSERLRTAISGLYTGISADRVTVTHGGIGANSLFLLSYVNPGDHVITTAPSYLQSTLLPESIGAEITTLSFTDSNDWRLDIDALRAAVRPETAMICLTNPNNPTGMVLSDEELDQIVEIARSVNAWLLIDEAYRGLTYDAPHFRKAACEVYEKGISTGTMSKTFSTAGIRLGWIAGPKEVIDHLNHVRDFHIISVGCIDDYIASLILENKERILERNINICRKNLELVTQFVNQEKHLSMIPPEAGTTAFPAYDMEMGSEELCLRLLREKSVLLVPGSAFESEGHFRLGFGKPYEIIENGLLAFSDWLKQF